MEIVTTPSEVGASAPEIATFDTAASVDEGTNGGVPDGQSNWPDEQQHDLAPDTLVDPGGGDEEIETGNSPEDEPSRTREPEWTALQPVHDDEASAENEDVPTPDSPSVAPQSAVDVDAVHSEPDEPAPSELLPATSAGQAQHNPELISAMEAAETELLPSASLPRTKVGGDGLVEATRLAAMSGGTMTALMENSVRSEAPALDGVEPPPSPPRKSRRPPRYQPLAQAPTAARVVVRKISERFEPVVRALPIELRLRKEHGDFWKLSLLPRRNASLPDALSVNAEDFSVALMALQDEWYQDVVRDDVGALMLRGLEWEASSEGEKVRWVLSGRELFVLAPHEQLSGFVTTPRLVIGEPHVVLCAARRASEVRSCLESCGCATPVQFDDTRGAPSGWVGFCDVVPKQPVKPSTAGDILDALCPQPDVDIALSGGIRLERSTWLSGFPPRIRLHGDAASAGAVHIDGQVAQLDSNQQGYVADNWDREGEHRVWCAGKTARYVIAPGRESWEAWEAYRWSLGDIESDSALRRPGICGVLTLPPTRWQGDQQGGVRAGVVVPATNPVLVGAIPGQIYVAQVRSDVHARTCTAFPPFEPVWALPRDPLHCDKRSARVLVAGTLKGPNSFEGGATVGSWCAAITAASRKGLLTEPQDAGVASTWERYKQAARAIRRRFR